MNYMMEEQLLAEHRKDIHREISKIRLEEQALQSRVFHPNLFTKSMQRTGKWLIKIGERLVQRYQAPAPKNCGQNQSYAH
jgi:hypothetical protein